MATIESWLETAERRARVDKRLADGLKRRFGLGMLDYRALRAVAAAEAGELRMQELARALDVNQSSVTRMVPRLEAGGLAYRDLCADDNRGAYCVITDAGRQACREMTEALNAILAEAEEAG